MSSELPCGARVADGAIRGGMVGVLWTAYFLPGDLRQLRTTAPGGVPLRAARATALTTAGFASFFGAYNGVFCGAERVFGEGVASPFLAGGVAGGALGAALGPPSTRLASVAVCAGATAVLCAGSHALVSFWRR
jgi:hypothetical protein